MAKSSASSVVVSPEEYEHPKTRLIPLTAWPSFHAWPTVGSLRQYVFYEKTNGFHKAVRRVGRRVLIDEAAFFVWVNERNEIQKGR